MSKQYVPSVKEFIEENVNKYKTRSEILEAGAKACQTKEVTVYKALSTMGLLGKFPLPEGTPSKFTGYVRVGDRDKNTAPTKKYAKKTRTYNRKKGLGGFQEMFDKSVIIPTAIEEGIEKFLVTSEGEPDWMYDDEFREKCKVSITNWRRYANEFQELQVKVDGKVVWGHPDIIEEMREVTTR
jgi:hypothetical protein